MQKSIKLNKKSIVLLGLIGFSIFFSSLMSGILITTEKEEKIQNYPKVSDLDPNSISINATKLYLRNEWINITLNNASSSSLNDLAYWANITIVQYSNGTSISNPRPTWNVSLVNIGTNLFSNLFQIPYSTVTGMAEISIIKLVDGFGNESTGNLTWFIIGNNAPKIGISLNSSSYKAGQSIQFQINPTDIENGAGGLKWTAQIVNNTNTISTLFTDAQIYQNTHLIPYNNSNYLPGTYYFKVTCTDLDSAVTFTNVSFTIVNNLPTINSITFNGIPQSSKPISIIRGSETLSIRVKASDVESNSSLRLTLSMRDPVNNTAVALNAVNLTMIDAANNLFEKNLTLPITPRVSIGNTNITVTVTGEYPKGNYYSVSVDQPIQILNNVPVLYNIKINNKTDDRINLTDKDTIEIEFNATDYENDIRFIRVELKYQDSEGQEQTFSYSVPYSSSAPKIQIRAVDLDYADYFVYAYVVDGDGAETAIEAPYIIEIKPNTSQDPITWLLMAVGLIVGLAIGFGLTYWRVRNMKIDQAEEKEILKDSGKIQANKAKSDEKPAKKDTDEENESLSGSNTPDSSSKSKKKVIRKL